MYMFAAESFDKELVDNCIDFALADGLPRVKPHKEHQYTNIAAIFVAESFDPATAKHIAKRSFSKSYKFSLHGYTELLTAAESWAPRAPGQTPQAARWRRTSGNYLRQKNERPASK
ncbi:MAG: hypothetical protein V8S72_00165 [Oscillospiraceae bacterium]